ncbi:MAG: prepilin-type N-terminal cleavage/methylation domain-containing protein [bacterium]
MRTRTQEAGFTLIELLVVIAIFSIMLVIALPAFESMSRRSLATVVPGLSSTLRLARQYAVTHRQPVWVVFPHNTNTSFTGIEGEADKAMRSYAVISSNVAQGLHYVSSWKLMPKGIYFGMNGSNNVMNFNGAGTMFPYPSDAGSSKNLPAVMFKPNGQAYRYTPGSGWGQSMSGSSFVEIPVTEGVADIGATNGIPTITYVGKTNITLQVVYKTGQVRYQGF